MKAYKQYLLQALLLGLCVNSAFGAWEMFSDGKDTYLYNTQSGDVYIRYNRGGKNYEDIFVKMPAGTLPSQLSPTQAPSTKRTGPSTTPPTAPQAPSKNDKSAKLLEQQQQALQKSQELLRNSIDTSGVLE